MLLLAFKIIGNICYLVAVVLSIVLGVKDQPFLISVLIGSAIFQVAYMIDHVSLMLSLFYDRKLSKIAMVILIQLFLHGIYASVLYGIGRGCARLF
jgi:hypothetical protein